MNSIALHSLWQCVRSCHGGDHGLVEYDPVIRELYCGFVSTPNIFRGFKIFLPPLAPMTATLLCAAVEVDSWRPRAEMTGFWNLENMVTAVMVILESDPD